MLCDAINNLLSSKPKTFQELTEQLVQMGYEFKDREEIQLHKAAKQAFDQLPEKKLPSRKILHEEFHQLLTEKKKAYAEYRQVKKDMQEYLVAKQTVEHILGINKQEKEFLSKKEATR